MAWHGTYEGALHAFVDNSKVPTSINVCEWGGRIGRESEAFKALFPHSHNNANSKGPFRVI